MTPQAKPNHPGFLNRRAIVKTAIVVAILVVAVALNFPLARVAKLWVEDVEYHMSNNTTWNGMTSKQKTAWISIPGYYLIGLFAFYGTAYRTHRKRLYINGLDEGTVMYLHGIDGVDSNFYDLACVIFNRFRHIPWEHVPRPISGDFYQDAHGREMLVIYYKLDAFVAPWRWKRIVIDDPGTLRIGVYTIWLEGQFETVVQHPYNPMLSYIRLSNDTPYDTLEPDYEMFEKYHEEILDRVQRTNITNLQGNPTIMGPSVRNNIMIQTNDGLKEEWDLLSDGRKAEIIRDIHEESKA